VKRCIARSSALTWIVIAVLIAATPFAIAEFFRTGEIYIFSKRLVDDMVARVHGPGRLRFIIQPIAALVLGRATAFGMLALIGLRSSGVCFFSLPLERNSCAAQQHRCAIW